MRLKILDTLENRDELIDESEKMDSGPYRRYIYKIKSWDPERLRRSLTIYKLQNLELDFLIDEEERSNIIKLISNTEPIIHYFKNLFYPVRAHLFFKTDSHYTVDKIEKLLEDPLHGISNNVPEPNKIKDSERWYKTTLKINDKKRFASKMNSFKQQNRDVEIFIDFEQPTLKTYSWVIAGVVSFIAKFIYDFF